MKRPFDKILTKLPHSPGVYFFYGWKNNLLYIGKATDLHERVSSYFRQPTGHYQRLIETFFDQVKNVKWQTTESTMEAMILESNLINQLQPKYNVEAKDDKTFLGIYITDEDFPRVFPARITNKKLPKGKFFGPYTSATMVKHALKILRRIFPWCNQKTSNQITSRPCLYYHIKLCPGPCANAIGQNDYQQIIKNLKLFLKGQKKQLISKTKRHMIQAAKVHNFEQAARLRNQLSALEHIHDIALQLNDDLVQLTRQQPWRLRIEGYDISNLSGQWAVGSMVTFIDGRPAKDFYRRFRIKTVQGIDDVGMMREVIKRRVAHVPISQYSKHETRNSKQIQSPNDQNSKHLEFRNSNFKTGWPLPDLILIDGGLGHYNAVQEIFDQNEVSVPLLAIAKGRQRKKNDLYGQDSVVDQYRPLLPTLTQVRDEAHRFAIMYHRTRRSQL